MTKGRPLETELRNQYHIALWQMVHAHRLVDIVFMYEAQANYLKLIIERVMWRVM